MSELQLKETEARQKTLGLWAAGIFAVLGLAFMIFSIYNVVILQQGQSDISDNTLLPVTILMFLAGLGGFLLIQRNRLNLGLWLVYMVVLIPPIITTLVIADIYIVSVTYIVVFAFISINWVFPKVSRRAAIIATVATLLTIAGIEFWNPQFRVISVNLAGFAPFAIGLGGLGLLAFSVRQALIGNILTKLTVAFAVLTILVGGITGSISQRSLQTSLTENIGNKLADQANSRGIEIATTIDREWDIVNTLALSVSLQNAAQTANETPLSQTDIKRFDQQWQAADAANNDADPLVSKVLNNPISDQLRSFRSQFEQHVEVFLTSAQGVSIATTNRTSDYNQADEEWWQIAYRDGMYVGQPEYDPSSKTIAMNMAVAVRENGDGNIVGILRTTVNFTTFANTLETGTFGQTGRTIILLPSGQELRLNAVGDGTFELVQEKALPELVALSQSGSRYQNISLNGLPTLVSTAPVMPVGDTEDDTQMVSNLNWRVATLQDEAEALQPVTTQTRNALIVGIFIMFAAIIVAVGLARAISGPIIRLNTFAQKIADGDITVQANVETRDEVGTLATTFNNMTRRLHESFTTMEHRIAERTHSLELAAEVGRSVSQVRALDVMLKDAAELIRSRFDLYYVQVYLTDSSQTNLLLQSGTGTVGTELVGRGHHLPLNIASINGRAAIEKRSVVVADTTASATFKPNPLLPDTRSEMAVPLLIGGKVVGVLDLQSQKANVLNQDILTAFEALAGQLAIAIQNATFLAETQQARAEVEAQAQRLSRTNWVDYLDAIHKPEEIGFVFKQNKMTPLAQAEQTQTAGNSNALVAPISVIGEVLGNLVVEMEGQSPIARADELVNTVARQVAQQIENLRLLDNAERFRFEAEQASRRLTREGWKDYMDLNAGKGLRYVYDLNEVRPDDGERQPEESAVTLPLKVRDEVIGKFVIQGIESGDSENLDLANAVAERLGAHIESLRQFDKTQSALAQSEKLFNASRRLAQASDLKELVQSIVETLDIPVINRAGLEIFDYDAAGELAGMRLVANWWNGIGHKSDAEGQYVTADVLRVVSLFLSPTPLFFNDAFHDERIDPAALQLVQEQNYRAFAVLPLFLGTRQLGIVILTAEEPYNFTQDEVRLFSALAPQVVTVMENRRQFERAQKQAERESTLNIISQKIQSATTVEAVLQIAARELGHALGAPMTIAQLSMKDKK